MDQVRQNQASAMPLRYLLALSVLASAITFALYYPTFRSAFALDDIEFINVTAAVLAGKRSLWSALLLPHDEHVAPLLRLLFLLYLKLFGLNATLWRVTTALVHACSAVCIGLIAWRYSGTPRAAVAATVVYVLPCGFSSMSIWCPSGAGVPIAFAALTGASALLAWRRHLRARRIIAGIAVLLALLFWRSFAPMALLPAVIDEIERRGAGARRPVGPFTIFCLGAIAFVVAGGARLIMMNVQMNIVHGAPRAIFLLLVTPYRLFFPSLTVIGDDWGRSTALLGVPIGIAAGSIIAALLAALWRNGAPRLAVVAALTAVPTIILLLLIGLYRFNVSYYHFIEADRYFYPLLIPLALLAGAVASSISLSSWPRVTRIVFVCALISGIGSEFTMHRQAMLHRFPAALYARYGRRMATLRLLVHRLEAAAPLELPKNIVWFDEWDRTIDPTVLTNLLSDGKRLRVGDHADGNRLNPLLDAWAQEIGEKVPYVRVPDGSLVNTHIPMTIDFGAAPFDLWVTGFLEWENPFRWMGRRGELFATLGTSDLDLRLAAPLSDLRRIHPDWSSMPVRVSLRDEESQATIFLGVANITEDGVQQFRFSTKALRARFGSGRISNTILDCERVWTPAEIYGTRDTRERTVQVYSGGTHFSDWQP
ncbi:MAG: hypothetical protein QOK37_437 [Thermoanaerobaculia bacterium]|nr:hypothetical protein [Thermoanaerobaculia bacterium]